MQIVPTQAVDCLQVDMYFQCMEDPPNDILPCWESYLYNGLDGVVAIELRQLFSIRD